MSRASRPFWGIRHRDGESTDRNGVDSMSGWEKEQFLLDSRRILVFQEISDDVLAETSVALQRLAAESKNDPIFMYISSDGGFVDSGLAIIDAMVACPCPVHTVVTGRAYSMAALIAAYGARRFITPNSSVMLHPIIYGLSEDYVPVHEQESGFISVAYDRVTDALARRMKTTGKALRKRISTGLWLSADDAIAAHIADEPWTKKMESALCDRIGKIGPESGKLRNLSQLLKFVTHQIDTGQKLDFEVGS